MKKRVIISILILLSLGGASLYLTKMNNDYKQEQALKAEEKRKAEIALEKDIKEHYYENVVVLNDSNLYDFNGKKYSKIGRVSKDIEFVLEERNVKLKSEYFKIKDMDAYVYYKDVLPKTEGNITKTNDIYKNYVPYNLDIETKDAKFYQGDKLLFELDGTHQFTVLGKSSERYYVELNHTFVSVPKENVTKEIEVHHTDQKVASDVAVINYHFFYDASKGETCNQVICHEKNVFVEHLNYLRDNNFFLTDMESFSMYMDGIIRLPEHSVLLTIDDGGQGVKEIAVPLLTEYKMHATLFLISAWYFPNDFENEYIECHSHTNEMHINACPSSTGQAGGLNCFDPERIKNDLQASRQTLHGTTVIAYPFYAYNDYAIEQLKNNGFTMAFTGGFIKAQPLTDKFKVPRYSVSTDWNMETFKNAVN